MQQDVVEFMVSEFLAMTDIRISLNRLQCRIGGDEWAGVASPLDYWRSAETWPCSCCTGPRETPLSAAR